MTIRETPKQRFLTIDSGESFVVFLESTSSLVLSTNFSFFYGTSAPRMSSTRTNTRGLLAGIVNLEVSVKQLNKKLS